MPEPFTMSSGTGAAAAPLEGPTTGGRRRRSQKLRTVKKSTVRRMLKAKGLKMRGGYIPLPSAPVTGGRRRRGRSQKRTRRRSIFGMKY
jgi:hypothetical protein